MADISDQDEALCWQFDAMRASGTSGTSGCTEMPTSMDDLNRFAAERVMEWKPYTNRFGLVEWCKPDEKTNGLTGRVEAIDIDWNPRENIKQAMMVADTYTYVSLAKANKGKWAASVRNNSSDPWNNSGWRDDPAEALTLAACRAAGYEG